MASTERDRHNIPEHADDQAPVPVAEQVRRLRAAAAGARLIASDVAALPQHVSAVGYVKGPEWRSICARRAAMYERDARGYETRADELEDPDDTPADS